MEIEESDCERDQVKQKLYEIGCCDICCLRFLGETNNDPYKNLYNSLKDIRLCPKENEFLGGHGSEDTSKSIKHQKMNPCVACLGLLQAPTCDDIIHKVMEEIKTENYDCDTFNIAITLPVVFQVRNHSMWIFLEENFPDYTKNSFPLGCVTVSVKDVWKWLYPAYIEKIVGKKYDINSELYIGINIVYKDNNAECSCLFTMLPELFSKKNRKHNKFRTEMFSRKGVESAFKDIKSEVFLTHCPSPPKTPSLSVFCENVTLQRNSIFIAGRYNKLSRELPQTPWIIGNERKMETSVQEIICEPLELETKAQGVKFGASGREDVDVRTLGRGRPFSVELINPKVSKLSPKTISELAERINHNGKGRVAVRDLQVSTKESLVHLKTGEEFKTKDYTALCLVIGPIPSLLKTLSEKAPITLAQETPIRVLHRRPVACRQKTINWIKTAIISNSNRPNGISYFTVTMNTQAGTYIKEFVHGDFGRTKPSLGELLGKIEVDILALDVQEIHLDWPPPVNKIET